MDFGSIPSRVRRARHPGETFAIAHKGNRPHAGLPPDPPPGESRQANQPTHTQIKPVRKTRRNDPDHNRKNRPENKPEPHRQNQQKTTGKTARTKACQQAENRRQEPDLETRSSTKPNPPKRRDSDDVQHQPNATRPNQKPDDDQEAKARAKDRTKTGDRKKARNTRRDRNPKAETLKGDRQKRT